MTLRPIKRLGQNFLVDPNTSTELFESADIVAYLEGTYAGR